MHLSENGTLLFLILLGINKLAGTGIASIFLLGDSIRFDSIQQSLLQQNNNNNKKEYTGSGLVLKHTSCFGFFRRRCDFVAVVSQEFYPLPQTTLVHCDTRLHRVAVQNWHCPLP